MKNIAIFGAGGFGREVHDLIDQINEFKLEWNFVGFFDDNTNTPNTVKGCPYIGGMNVLNSYSEKLYVVIAIGEPETKQKILSSITNPNVLFATLVHPRAILGNSNYLTIGEGSIITAGVVITTNIKIGKHVILNLNCTVGHDTEISDFCAFMPSVNISGDVFIGEKVYVGTGAQIINQLSIGENTTVGAGSVVTKNIPANCVAVGIPAKIIKTK
jgi:sugar O-acyltransferase (sialic acid O-acetyltransferase NeuD family)